jgi:pimeloyl-ACP methyl ester carboxylesterase
MSDLERGLVQSRDGTEIAFIKVGNGTPLVIVHGSLATGEAWLPVARILAARFTCYLMDRRGHGRSGDTSSYNIQREYDDINSILRVAGAGASLLGHSYGAVCALGTAITTPLNRLILYEPPLSVKGPVSAGALPDYKKAVASGNLDEALALGLNRFAGVTLEQIKVLRESAFWRGMVLLAPTWTREVEVMDQLGPSLKPYEGLLTPTLLLTGTLSPKYPLRDATDALAATLKNAQLSRLEGQGHTAHSINPTMIAERITGFLLASDRR